MATTAPFPFRFAIQGGPFADPDALSEHARSIEQLGYAEFYTSDHVGAPGSDGRKGGLHVVDPFAPLLTVAAATTHLRVGPLVLNNEFHNTALLARTAATVDRMTSGRLVLGLGTGYAQSEHDAIGMPLRPPGARVSRFGESLTVLRALLDTGSCDHRGEHVFVSLDDLGVSPVQEHVPFLVGGHGRRVVRLAARHADIFQFTGLTHDKDGTPSGGGFALREVAERARWLEEDAGARSEHIERSALVQFVACGDDALSDEDLAAQFEMTPEIVRETPFILNGSVEQVVDKIERLRETLGISHYVVRDPDVFAPVVEALT